MITTLLVVNEKNLTSVRFYLQSRPFNEKSSTWKCLIFPVKLLCSFSKHGEINKESR